MKKAVILLFLIFSFQAPAQNKVPFDIQQFYAYSSDAEWLYYYDMVAWWSSDSVMSESKEDRKRLGEEWFCYQDEEKIWHAAYGEFEHGSFDLVFHYIINKKAEVERVYETIDTGITHPYSRALQTSVNAMSSIRDSAGIRFNQYIRRNEDNTFKVWILPAFQPNGIAVYGGEFIYTLDASGTRILKDESYFQGKFRGFKVDEPREISLNYRELEAPTPGAVFFVWYYKSYFTRIMIDNAGSMSTVIQSGDSWTWLHTLKPSKKQEKKKKK